MSTDHITGDRVYAVFPKGHEEDQFLCVGYGAYRYIKPASPSWWQKLLGVDPEPTLQHVFFDYSDNFRKVEGAKRWSLR